MPDIEYGKVYAQWLADFADNPALMRELSALTDEKEIEDRFYTELAFGTGGLRGVLGYGTNRMNEYVIRRATRGLAQYLLACEGGASGGVVIAYDSRRRSAELARETALTLCAAGVRAYLFDRLHPVPMLSYAVRRLGAAAGVVVTASHNPPQYNGYKVYGRDGGQIGPEAADSITSHIRALPYKGIPVMDEGEALSAGLLTYIGDKEVGDDYIAMLRTLCLRPALLASQGARLKVVYTPLHGSGNIPVRRCLAAVGIKQVFVVPRQEAPDGDFPTVTAPNPEDPAAFALAIPLANQTGADVILATDPDCDRLGVAVRDDQGAFRTLTGNQIGCLLAHHVLSQRKALGTLPANGAVCKSLVSTELARAICADYGVACYDTLTGFKFIGEMIQRFEDTGEHTFLFGFEESYGALSGTQVRDKDGVNAALLIAEAACVCLEEGITLWQRLGQLYARYGHYCELVVSRTLPGRDGVAKIQSIMRALRQQPPAAFGDLAVLAARDYLSGLRTQDGASAPMGLPRADVLYYELSGGCWLCIRPSGTEPKIKLYVSTRDDAQAGAAARNAALLAAAEKLLL